MKALISGGIRERVAERLRDAIVRGELKPGDPLKDVDLAQTLRTSRGPIREALLQLEKESLVRNVHNRGWFVIELSPEEVSDIVSLRVALEAVAIRQAARLITPAKLVQVRRRYDKLFELAQRDEMVSLLRADFEFHQQIWTLAGHPLLKDELVRISAPYFAYMQATIRQAPVPSTHFNTTAIQHLRIVDYLENPERWAVEEVLAEHFRSLNIPGWDRLTGPRPVEETGKPHSSSHPVPG